MKRKPIRARWRLSVLLGASAFILASCSTGPAPLQFSYESASTDASAVQTGTFPAYPDFRMVHISDTHTYDPALGIEGAAFQNYLNHDRKLLDKSTEILDAVEPRIAEQKPDFVVVSGDLTKDGEKIDHQWFAAWCARLEASGTKVYVLPGNHDINNPHAVRFAGEKTEPVEQVAPAQFAAIYQDFGYGEALERDPASLSYLAQPLPGLWLLVLDSANYEDNLKLKGPVTSGRIRPATLTWAEDILVRAQKQGVAVMASMHHGLVEHWPGQKKFNPEYVVENDLDLQRFFAHYGVRIMLTGHYHSQDIALAAQKDGTFVYDVECGSMMTWPTPWRIMDFKGNSLEIHTRGVESIASVPEFGPYSRNFTETGIKSIARNAVKKFGLNTTEIESIADQSGASFLSHYWGDEKVPADRPVPDRRSMGLMGNLILDNLGYVLSGQVVDSPCADRNVRIDLDKGTWVNLDS